MANSGEGSAGQKSKVGKVLRKKLGQGGFVRILGYATWFDRLLMTVAAVCSAGAGAALPIMTIVFGKLVGSFTGYFTAGSAVTEKEFRHGVDRNALYLFLLFIGKFALGYVSTYAFRMSGIRISAALRLAYLSSLFELPVSVIDKLPAGEATDALTNIANTIQFSISDKLGSLVQGFSLVIAAYVIAFVYSWRLTLVSSSVIIFVTIMLRITTPHLMKHYISIIGMNAGASGVAGQVLQGIRTIKSLGAEEEAMRWHSKFLDLAQVSGSKLSIWVSMQFWPAFFATYANMALTFWTGVKFYSEGLVPGVGNLTTVLFAVLIVLAGIGNIFTPLQSIIRASSASVSVWKIIDAPKSKPGGLQPPDVKAEEDVKFENVRFTYPSRPDAEILKGVNFTIKSGQVTAFVGHSGCGKSTIVALLERWYELSDINEPLSNAATVTQIKIEAPIPDGSETSDSTGVEENKVEEKSESGVKSEAGVFQNAGRILVGERSLEEIDRKWWRSQIGLVQQEPVLFNETIFENVSKGLLGSQWEDAPREEKFQLVEEACREAFADEYISKFPQGYDTVVGESGIKLSGGQRQRLAIARSIIKKPTILILDEATSSIDVRGEQLVSAALDRASRGRTTVVIAHRLSTIRRADHIVLLQEGRTIEEGTHDELVTKEGGLYSDLVQASNLEFGHQEEEARIQHEEGESETSRPEKQQNSVQEHKSLNSVLHKVKAKVSFRSVGYLLIEQKRYYLLYFFALAGAMGAGAAVPIQAWIFSHIIAVFQETDKHKLKDDGSFWALMLFIVAIAAAISYATIGYFSNTISFRVSTVYRKSYFESVLTKPIHWFDEEDRSFGTLTGQLGSDPQQLQELLGVNIAFPLIAIFNLMGCTIVSFIFGWKLSLVIFFASLPVILIAAFFRIRYEMLFVAMNEKVFAESSKFAAEAITSFRTVTALTLEDAISKRYKSLLDGHIHDAFLKARFTILIFALSDSLEFCSMALGFWYGGRLLATREYDSLQFFIIYAALIQGAQAAGQFLAIGPNVANATAAANRIIAYRQGSESISAKKSDNDSEKPTGCKLEFRNVGFQYPTRDVPVYRNLSFTIEPGQFVAFVGPSGCGKTTIISLLERFYSVNTGSILINDQNITGLSLSHYRSLCGLVTQEPTLFDGTVRENLILGLPSGSATPQDAIDAACKAAEIYDFVVSLSQSFDTPLSAGMHSSLSGGQKQRLCIARALLRTPQLLMLDEATNSLDSVSEGLVQKAIEQLGGSRALTIIVVAHRLATVQRADRIIVMGDGGVTLEDGTHSELIQKKGVYWDMCKAQALDR
ncbi:lipid A export ATP-binding/permease protein msbA [Clohesyomyces aquaticus]|uniref:Lipid A export ATP-binding/permease protein msbA n=1 Tax=Clohesyomyces aquaticus TaxID=1231657 RepID=A0A1Y1XZC9_9PLEO|nr:lipid A export ATP-binding/permease protein msbA [Clohesyomyces aquaticus]